MNEVGRSVEPSKTLAVAALAKRLKAEGKDIISLTAGEPDFKTPAHVARAGIDAINEGATRYTAAAGEPELRAAIAKVYSERWHMELKGENVCVSSGAKPLLYYLMSIFLEKDDEVLFPVPYWVSYEAMVNMCNGKAVPVQTTLENGHKLTANALDQACSPKSKILLLNNPTNPTGAVYDSNELLAIAEVARENDLIIISDEIYEDLVYGGKHQSLYNLTPWLPERTIAVSGVSKSFAMTGWRIGYTIAAAEVIKTLASYQSQALSSPCQISQRAALAGMTGDREAIDSMRDAFGERLTYCQERMSRLGLPFVEPRGAFYIFFDTSEICAKRGWADGQEFCTHLLEEKGVALVPGDAFGMPSWARISFAASQEDLANAFDRLEDFLG
ncbi:MAG: pyridoxal phosphate-dependent aminotransferase [bacterium]|nr:pyridoxal phosphate-dependent aminotransferase [bacterium]